MEDTNGIMGGSGNGFLALLLLFGLFSGGTGLGGNKAGNNAYDIPNTPLTNDQFITQNGFNGITNKVDTISLAQVNGFNVLNNNLTACCCDIKQQMATGFGAVELQGCRNTNEIVNAIRDEGSKRREDILREAQAENAQFRTTQSIFGSSNPSCKAPTLHKTPPSSENLSSVACLSFLFILL